ncbi:hypothetical protein [Planctomicrobium sp. SH527]|uniref:bestrophin-like domain n=1 Tax=Planctomicrobium sp. SH527 TaxID=3448123 RepID=UPI003F5BD8B5
MQTAALDVIPIWCVLPLILVFCLVMMEAGYRLGKWRHSHVAQEKEAPVAAMAAAVLGLLAFMLAFTFSLAASRFEARRQAVLEEANAIGTTYLRTRLLPEPQGSEVAKLLRRYTEIRTQRMTSENIGALLAESEKLHKLMWSHAVAAAEKNPEAIMTGLFLESLNESIDLHSTRVYFGIYSRIPITIWLALFSLVVLGMISLGYQAGLSATCRSLEMPIFALAFSCVLYLIIDLDRAHEGLLKISQQATINLYNSMQAKQP